MKTTTDFKKIDFAGIKQKVAEAEKNISGEIVPVIVSRCSDYSNAIYRGTLIGILGTFLVLVLIDRYLPGVAIYDPLWYFIFTAAGGGVASILVYLIPALKRLLAGKDALDSAAEIKANLSFCEEEVFNTKQRTGIMIFIALFERKVIVRADTGIAQIVEQETWDELVNKLTGSIKHGNISEGLITAVETCGTILKEKDFHASPDDTNELSNEIRIKGEDK